MARGDWAERLDSSSPAHRDRRYWVRRDQKYYVGIDEYGWELREFHSYHLKDFDSPEAAMDYADEHYPMEKNQ